MVLVKGSEYLAWWVSVPLDLTKHYDIFKLNFFEFPTKVFELLTMRIENL